MKNLQLTNTNEPTTGEIVRALRYCADVNSICGDACPAHLDEAGCRMVLMRNAADLLEGYKRVVVDKDREIATLTARAESAEAREKAIVENLRDRCEFCIGYELEENDEPCNTCYNARTFEPDDIPRTKNWTWRGVPQGGEGNERDYPAHS